MVLKTDQYQSYQFTDHFRKKWVGGGVASPHTPLGTPLEMLQVCQYAQHLDAYEVNNLHHVKFIRLRAVYMIPLCQAKVNDSWDDFDVLKTCNQHV